MTTAGGSAGSSAIGRHSSSVCPTTIRAGLSSLRCTRPYLRSLAPDRRVLVEKHRLLDVALKVVGVGSVGTHCYIALFVGPGGRPAHPAGQGGPRVGPGAVPRARPPCATRASAWSPASGSCRPSPTASWAGRSRPRRGTEYYVRQLHDMKYGIDRLDSGRRAWSSTPRSAHGHWPGRMHAPGTRPRSPATSARATSSTMRSPHSPARYADQTERDHAALSAAIKSGKVVAETGI